MTITQYLDLAYHVIVEERVRRGMTLYDALEETREWAAGSGGVQVAATSTSTASTASGNRGQSVEEMNNESMKTLMGAMGGISGGFG